MTMANNHNNGEQVLGLLLSIFYGMIVVALVTHFSDIIHVLEKQAQPSSTNWSLKFISWTVVILYSLNTLRMGHGFIISLFDERNPTFVGKSPYCPSEMLIFILTLLVPYISIILLSNFWSYEWPALYESTEKTNCFWLLVLYMAPHLIYPIWDITLRYSLHKKNRTDENVILYKKFAFLWLIIDGAVYLIILILWAVLGVKLIELTWLCLLVIFGLIHLIIFIVDYLIFNKEYYFPSCKVA